MYPQEPTLKEDWENNMSDYTVNKSLLSTPEETVWSMRINKAMEWRKRFSQETMWPEIDRIYEHKYGADMVPHFNLIFIQAQTLIPNLVFQAPSIINTPTKPGMVQWASLWDSVDNWWIDQAEIKDVAMSAVLDAYLHNNSHAFIGYDFDDQLQQDMREVSGSANRTRRMNAPWVDLVPSHRVLYATGTKKLRDCPWAAKFVTVPTKILKGRKGLKNVASSNIPSDIMMQEGYNWEYKDSSKYTAFWQIHNSETKKWCWLSTSGKFILPWEDDPLQTLGSGLPCEALVLNKNTRSIWGTADPIYIMSQHLEGDDVRLQGLKQRRLAVPKFIYDANVLDEEVIHRVLTADTPAGIPIELEATKSIKDVIMELTTVPNFGLMEYAKMLLQDSQYITGTGPNQMGTFAPGRRSATEASIVEGVSTSRTSNRRQSVGDFIEGLVKKANILCANNWSEDIVQQVLGYDGRLYWVNASSNELKKNGFDVTTKVNVESLAPVSRERRKQEAADLLNLLSTMTEAGANPMPILKQLLAQFEWVDVSQVLPQESSPMGMNTFIQQQEGMLAGGGVGPIAQGNMGGLNALIQKLPREVTTNEAEDRTNR